MAERTNQGDQVLLETIEDAAVLAAIEASKAVLPYWSSPTNPEFASGTDLEITAKETGLANFVTAADHKAGAVIRDIIGRYPGVASVRFRTEESVDDPGQTGEPWWNIDEIDGTANFSRGSDHFGISIGFHAVDDTPEVGVIAFPARGELILARRQLGAKLLDFSGTQLADLTGHTRKLPANPDHTDLFVAYDLGYRDRAPQLQKGALRLADRVGALKSYHSSSYTLGELALGKLDAFFACSATIYDIGASSVVIEAIGGKVTDMNGDSIDWDSPERSFLAARTPQIHQQVLELLRN